MNNNHVIRSFEFHFISVENTGCLSLSCSISIQNNNVPTIGLREDLWVERLSPTYHPVQIHCVTVSQGKKTQNCTETVGYQQPPQLHTSNTVRTQLFSVCLSSASIPQFRLLLSIDGWRQHHILLLRWLIKISDEFYNKMLIIRGSTKRQLLWHCHLALHLPLLGWFVCPAQRR